jgi:hypothetical protein
MVADFVGGCTPWSNDPLVEGSFTFSTLSIKSLAVDLNCRVARFPVVRTYADSEARSAQYLDRFATAPLTCRLETLHYSLTGHRFPSPLR